MKRPAMNVFWGMLLAVWLAAAKPAGAAYPGQKSPYINDYAGVLHRADYNDIERMFKELKEKHGYEVVAVTVKSYKYFRTGEATARSFAENLFHFWKIGERHKNKGILIFVSLKEAACFILYGEGVSGRFEKTRTEVPKKHMLPYFSVRDYSRGIFEGSRVIYEEISRGISAAFILFKITEYAILLGLLGLVVAAGVSCKKQGRAGWGYQFFTKTGTLLLAALKASGRWLEMKLTKGKGFGEVKPFGGGASGRW